MAIGQPVTAEEIGRAFAELVRADDAAQRLWIRPWEGDWELWLLTAPVDMRTEGQFQMAAIELEDRFPDTYIELRVINPRHFPTGNPASLIPAGAQEICLRAV